MSEVKINVAGADEYPEYLRMLIVGQPGVGKTTLASRFPNPLWVNAGSGITTLAKLGDIPYVNVSSEMDLFGLKQLLSRSSGEREELIGRPVDTLVVDTVDELQRLLLVERLKNEKRSETKMEDWGWLNQRFHAIFAGLTQLPLHVVFIAHTKDVSVGDDTIFKPALAGQFCEHIHEYVDMSLWMRSSTMAAQNVSDVTINGQDSGEMGLSMLFTPSVERWLLTTPHAEAEWVNDKTGTLPMSVSVNDDIFDVIHGAVTSVTIAPSSSFEVEVPSEDEAPQVEEAVQEVERVTDEGQELCSSCSSVVDAKTWSDLSQMRFGVVLCGDCYKAKDK
jgi:hypothetical protein